MSEILRRLRDEPNWNPSFGPGGLSRQEAKVWHQTCVLAADELERLTKENERLTHLISVSGGLKCPNCDDEGFTAEQDGHGEWYQEQCEFCYTVDDSIFMRGQS